MLLSVYTVRIRRCWHLGPGRLCHSTWVWGSRAPGGHAHANNHIHSELLLLPRPKLWMETIKTLSFYSGGCSGGVAQSIYSTGSMFLPNSHLSRTSGIRVFASNPARIKSEEIRAGLDILTTVLQDSMCLPETESGKRLHGDRYREVETAGAANPATLIVIRNWKEQARILLSVFWLQASNPKNHETRHLLYLEPSLRFSILYHRQKESQAAVGGRRERVRFPETNDISSNLCTEETT